MNLAEYRRSNTRLADFLPWAALVGEGVVLNKDGSFQRTARFRGPDLDSAVPAELVAVAVLLHDLGLSRGGAPDLRFEVIGANAARTFALSHEMGERRAEAIWDAIAMHTSPSIAQFKSVDVACTGSGIGCDYGGFGYQELSEGDKKAVLSAYPRLHMKNALTTCLCDIAKNHPNTTRDNFIADFGVRFIPGYTRTSAVDLLHQAPFAE